MTSQEEYERAVEARREQLNREHGVIETVNELFGWHLVDAFLHRPGVYRIAISRKLNNGAEFRNGFARQEIITAAREFGYLSAPNGYTLPR